MHLIVSSKTCQVLRRTKRIGVSSPLPCFLRPVNSQVMVPLCLRKCQNPMNTLEEHGNDSSILEETDSEFVMVVALLPFQG